MPQQDEIEPLVPKQNGVGEVTIMDRARKYVAEFVGTYILMVAIGGNVIAGNPHFSALSIACTLMVMVYSFAAVSGSHFNPAVTFAVFLCKSDFGIIDALFYVVVQIAGAFAGAGTYIALFDKMDGVVVIAPQAPFTTLNAVWVESVYTFFLVFCILCVALPKVVQGNEYYGICIGFCIVAGGYATGVISGGVLNPAVALSAAVTSGKKITYCFAFMGGEMIGSAVAVVFYRFLMHPEEYGYTWMPKLVSRLSSEFIGVFIIVFTVGLNATAAVTPDASHVALSVGGTVMCAIFALAPVSGAHLNPAVTISIWVSRRGKISFLDSVLYMVTQMLAGLIAGVAFAFTTQKSNKFLPLIGNNPGFTIVDLALAEGIFTFVLCFTILCTATIRSTLKSYAALAIGFCVIAAGYSIGPISGAHINPAVTLGLDMSPLANPKPQSVGFGNIWDFKVFMYWLGQFFGGLAATGVFFFTHRHEYELEGRGTTIKIAGKKGETINVEV